MMPAFTCPRPPGLEATGGVLLERQSRPTNSSIATGAEPYTGTLVRRAGGYGPVRLARQGQATRAQ